jgi:hypothetical protein
VDVKTQRDWNGGGTPQFGSLSLGEGIVRPLEDDVVQEESARGKRSCPIENRIYSFNKLVVMANATVLTTQTVILSY